MDTPLAGPPALLRALNARAVLDVLDARGPLARPEIVEATGLSKTTVAQALRALTEGGVVVEAGLDHGRRGPAATLYEVGPGRAFGLGVDVGRTRVRVELVDATGAVRARAERAVAVREPEERADVVAGLARTCLAEVGAQGAEPARLAHAVVGVPAIVGADHVTVRRVPGQEKGGPALHAALEKALGCPVVLENDVNLATLAEQRVGAATDVGTFVVLALGDGFGAGLVVDGRLHRGNTGGAGEVSFLPQPGRPLGTETLGGAALAAIGRDAGADPGLSLREAADRASDGDVAAGRVLDEVAERLAIIAASMALVLDPEKFVLAHDAALDAVAHRVRAFLTERLAVLPLQVVASALGCGAVVLGASGLAREALRDDAFRAAVQAEADPSEGDPGAGDPGAGDLAVGDPAGPAPGAVPAEAGAAR